jgi:hypothetical protein
MIRVFIESGVLRLGRGRPGAAASAAADAAGRRIGVARSVFFCRVMLYNGIMKLQT